MYLIPIVGIGVTIGIFIAWGLEYYNTQEYRMNFKRNLEEWKRNDNHET